VAGDTTDGELAEYEAERNAAVIKGDGFVLAVSNDYVKAGGKYMPMWMEYAEDGHDGPDRFCRVELRDDIPRLVELTYSAAESQTEVRQKHLRDTNIADLIDVLYGMLVIEIRDGEAVLNLGELGSRQDVEIRNFLADTRMGKGKRRITDELLRQVAEVYRANIDNAPTEAVARTFGQRTRQASTYVQKARERGYLPPTTQGRKKA
jgi:hypothetical protein